MSEENISSAAEAASVEATQAKPAEPKQEAEQRSTDEQQAEQPKPAESFSRQHKVHLKKQAELRKEREAFEAERAQEREQIEQEKARLSKWEEWEQAGKNKNPWVFLRDNGYDMHTLRVLAAENEQSPEVVATAMAEKLRKEFQEKFDASEAQRQRELDEQKLASVNQKRAATLGEIDMFLKANQEQYELSSVFEGAQHQILEIIWKSYEDSGFQEVMTYQQAADALEAYLDQEIRSNPVFRTGKAKKFLLDASGNVVTQEKKPSAGASKDRSKHSPRASKSNPQPRTLLNKVSSVSTSDAPPNETWEQKKERLFDEWSKKKRKANM